MSSPDIPELMRRYAPAWDGIAPLPISQSADNGDMVCIETSVDMIPYLITAWEIYRFEVMFNGDATERRHTWEQMATLLSQIMLAEACEDCSDCPPPPTTPQTLFDDKETRIVKAMTGDIYIYQGCCPDDVPTPTGSSSSSSGGGSSGGSWVAESDIVQSVPTSKVITPCDVVTYLIPYIFEQGREFALWLDNNADNVSDVIDGFGALTEAVPILGTFTSQGTDWLTDLFEAQTGGLLELFGDEDFLLRVQQAFIKAHGSRSSFTQITRDDLLAITKYLPWVWLVSAGVAAPRIIWDGWSRVIRMGKVNERLILAQAQGNTTLCNYLYSEANMTYTPPTVGSVAPISIGDPVSGYDWRYTWDFLADSNGTGTGTGGWVSGPTTAAVWAAGLGWGGGGSATNDHISRIVYAGANGRSILGVQVVLDAGMGGDSNLVGVYIDDPQVTIYQEAHPGEKIVNIAEAFSPTTQLDVAIAEFNFNGAGGDELTKYIQRINLYGTGTPPADGTPF